MIEERQRIVDEYNKALEKSGLANPTHMIKVLDWDWDEKVSFYNDEECEQVSDALGVEIDKFAHSRLGPRPDLIDFLAHLKKRPSGYEHSKKMTYRSAYSLKSKSIVPVEGFPDMWKVGECFDTAYHRVNVSDTDRHG